MSLLNFESPAPSRNGSKKAFKLILGIGTLVGTIALGSTFAASINLNSGGPVEFGQGVTQATACDDEVTITPTSGFVNATGEGSFKFTGLTLSNLDTSNEGCAEKIFTIKTYDSNGSQLQPTYAISVDSEGIFSSPDGDINGTEEVSENSLVTLTFDGTLIDAESVYRITIESEDLVSYQLGETGPGGGTVYYYSAAGFNCGPAYDLICNYLEFAPSGWNETAESTGRAWATGTASSGNAILDVDGVTGSGGGIAVANDSSNDISTSTVGLGYRNSIAIVNQGNGATTAAGTARAYTGGSLSDWYLPNTTELNLLYDWKTTYGAGSEGFFGGRYWASSEKDNVYAYWQHFGSGAIGDYVKNDNTYKVRAIRAF
jgi:hypothetical protein